MRVFTRCESKPETVSVTRSAATGRRAARRVFYAAFFFGEAVRVLGREEEENALRSDLSRCDRELRHEAVFILHFHRQGCCAEDRIGEPKNLHELRRVDAMVFIAGHPRLQQARLQRADSAATVDEIFPHMPDFRDVKMGGDEPAIR